MNEEIPEATKLQLGNRSELRRRNVRIASVSANNKADDENIKNDIKISSVQPADN